MDLEYLNGVPDTNYKVGDSQDFMGLMGEQEALAELGKLFKRKAASGGGGGAPKKRGLFKKKPAAEGGEKKKKGAKIKNFLKKGLHLTNKLNPAAATLRAGILAAMKINFMKIASQIRYAYLTDEQAQQKGLLMDRFRKMKNIREKLEKIFYGAGGKPENLKKAILTGRGNKDKSVPMSGLGYIPYENVDGLNEDMPLSQLIGSEMYADEMHGVHGLGELGEPATAATIAAATTVLTTIVALIKSVGSLVPKKKSADAGGGESGGGGDAGGGEGGEGGEGSDAGSGGGGGDSSSDSGSSDSESDSGGDSGSDEGTNGSTTTKNTPATTNEEGDSGDGGSGGSGGSQNKSAARTSGDGTTKPTFWENNKKWIKPVGIGVGSLGLLALIYHLLKPKPKPMNGVPAKRRRKKKSKGLLDGLNGTTKKGGNHKKRRSKPKGKKKVVTLL